MDKILKCPRCSNLLNSYKLRKIKHPSGAILDVCDVCHGMWLDGPEVKLLSKFKFKNKSSNRKGGKK